MLNQINGFRGFATDLVFDSRQLSVSTITAGDAIQANGLTFLSNTVPVDDSQGVLSAARTVAFSAEEVTNPIPGEIAIIRLDILPDAAPGNTTLSLFGQINEDGEREIRSNLITLEIVP